MRRCLNTTTYFPTGTGWETGSLRWQTPWRTSTLHPSRPRRWYKLSYWLRAWAPPAPVLADFMREEEQKKRLVGSGEDRNGPWCDAPVAHSKLVTVNSSITGKSAASTHRHTHTFSRGLKNVEKTPLSNLIDTHTKHHDAAADWTQLHPQSWLKLLSERREETTEGGMKKRNLKRPVRMTNDFSASLVSLARLSLSVQDPRISFFSLFFIWTSVALNAMRLITDPNHVLQGYAHDCNWAAHTFVTHTLIRQRRHC